MGRGVCGAGSWSSWEGTNEGWVGFTGVWVQILLCRDVWFPVEAFGDGSPPLSCFQQGLAEPCAGPRCTANSGCSPLGEKEKSQTQHSPFLHTTQTPSSSQPWEHTEPLTVQLNSGSAVVLPFL